MLTAAPFEGSLPSDTARKAASDEGNLGLFAMDGMIMDEMLQRGRKRRCLILSALSCAVLSSGCGDDSQVKSLKLSVEEYRQQVARYHTEALEQREIVENLKKSLDASERKIQLLNRELMRAHERIGALEAALKKKAAATAAENEGKKDRVETAPAGTPPEGATGKGAAP